MAAGLPVLSTRVGALGEMLDEERGGHFVAPGDVLGPASALRELAASRELRTEMGRRIDVGAKRNTDSPPSLLSFALSTTPCRRSARGMMTAGSAAPVHSSMRPGPSRVRTS